MRKNIKQNPKTFKYDRVFRIKIDNSKILTSFVMLNNYEYGLKALECGKIKKHHLELCLRLLRKLFKKTIYLKINVSLIIPFSKKPLEMRMGKGKGQRHHWEYVVSKGLIFLEIGNLKKNDLIYALRLISERLPFLTKIVKNIY